MQNQFQEKLAELAPLPEILKQSQVKLQECQQAKLMAEHTCEDLSRELLAAKEKMDCMESQISDCQWEIQKLHVRPVLGLKLRLNLIIIKLKSRFVLLIFLGREEWQRRNGR